jgi:hypothetical protein
MKRTSVVQEIPLTSVGKFLKVTLFYDEGGVNYLTGSDSLRGYYLGTRVVEKQGAFESFDLLSGFRHLVEPAIRFSRKKLDLLTESACRSSCLPGMIESTLARSGETLRVSDQS